MGRRREGDRGWRGAREATASLTWHGKLGEIRQGVGESHGAAAAGAGHAAGERRGGFAVDSGVVGQAVGALPSRHPPLFGQRRLRRGAALPVGGRIRRGGVRRAGARVVRRRDGEGRRGGRLVAGRAALPGQRRAPLLRAGVAVHGAAGWHGRHRRLVPGEVWAPWWHSQVAVGGYGVPAQPRAAGSATDSGVDGSSPKSRAGRRVGSHCPVEGAGAPRQRVDAHHVDLLLLLLRPRLGVRLEAGSAIGVVGAGVERARGGRLEG